MHPSLGHRGLEVGDSPSALLALLTAREGPPYPGVGSVCRQ